MTHRPASLALALMFLSPPALAEGDPEVGAALYAAHCAACHGSAGAGDGPMVALLAVPVPDLTGYAARHGGALPVARLSAVIMGDAVLRGHGNPMPVFGPVAMGPAVALDAADGSPVQTTRPVADLIAYLATLQD